MVKQLMDKIMSLLKVRHVGKPTVLLEFYDDDESIEERDYRIRFTEAIRPLSDKVRHGVRV